MTKISAIGNFHTHWYAHHWIGLRESLRQLPGVEVQILDPRQTSDAQVRANLCEFQPDIVLCCTMDACSDFILDRVKEWGAFTVLWFCDLRRPEPRDLAGRLDLLAMTGAGWLDDYSKAWGLYAESQTIWLPQACLPLSEMLPYDHTWACDILHIGSEGHPEFHEGRRFLFQTIRRRYGRRFRMLNPATDYEKAEITAELPRLYRSAHISIGACSAECAGYHSNRIFLATGNAACYFCNDYEGLDSLFMPGEEVAVYDDVTDVDAVLTQIEYLIQDELTRERIREAGFHRAQEQHTYPKRVRMLFNKIQERR